MNAALPAAVVTLEQVDLNALVARARQHGTATVEALATDTGLESRELTQWLADRLAYPLFDTLAVLAAQPDWQRLPLARAIARQVLPVIRDDVSYVLLSDPCDAALLDFLAVHCPLSRLALAEAGDIRARLLTLESAARTLDPAHTSEMGSEQGARGEELSLVRISEDSNPVIRLVNATLYDALQAGASDIHFETTAQGVLVKYRIDGVLDTMTEAAGVELAMQAISRIKVLAELDIAERRVPQDGRFRVSLGGRSTDLRVSIMPSIHGEDAVLRILDKRQLVPAGASLTLDLLGFDPAVLGRIRSLAAEPYGMLLVTGPTGSGKTTTLYAALAETLNGRDKVITIEDPVEYELPGVLQIPVNEKKGLTFARGLRSILRHDPDKILVGEIRDAETAEIAVQSALTGHLVLSSVHANSVFDVFSRFAHMNIDTHALVAALNGIWAQRLLRCVCRNCARETHADDVQLARLGLAADSIRGRPLWQGQGCGDCRGTGYKGRRAIAEVLVLNDSLRELLLARAPISQIKQAATSAGTNSLRDAALAMALKGDTTLDEVFRVTLQS